MKQFQECEGCDEGDVELANCIECGRRLCRLCLSCAGQCADCAAKAKHSALECALCRNREKELCCCAVCHSMFCGACVLQPYRNRPTTFLCRGCQASSSLAGAVTVCGRCNETIRDESKLYYCELCAHPLCRDCLPAAFECGVLKCQTCCPSPVRLVSKDRHARTLLSDELSSLIASILHEQPSDKSTAAVAVPAAPAVTSPARPSALTKSVANTTSGAAFSKYRRLRKHEKLGEGGQGVVFKCTTLDNEVVVSKEMTFDDNERAVFEARLVQAQKMRKLSHNHLIRYLDVIGTENPLKICVIMPYYSEGDLSKYISRQRGPIEESTLCSIILQLAHALDYLHSQNPPLAHCDVKPDNILLLNCEQVLLMDLDLCHSCGVQASLTMRVLHECKRNSPTFEYRAPELVSSAGSTESDIFSLGVVAFVLATLPEFAMLRNSKGAMMVLNHSDWTPDSLARAVRRAIREHTGDYPEELIDLIIEMLRHQPASRPRASEVKERLTTAMANRLLR
ncbi:putative protein kinase [Trypanosoma conorhini]|uniref:Protein kinase domain-containing protein n=1 Tax=Trypanosoma conorhini TaxID=83891 RepID=A0A422NC21_9TRYP|nr:putative protein kinase [Trypanosoma conorhini]RNF03038.1 putative protein kinase [Trypanosoma conorhini]